MLASSLLTLTLTLTWDRLMPPSVCISVYRHEGHDEGGHYYGGHHEGTLGLELG